MFKLRGVDFLMDTDSIRLTATVLFILFLVLSACFTFAEVSIMSINENKLKKMADDGNRRAQKVRALASTPSLFFTLFRGAGCFSLLACAISFESAFYSDFYAIASKISFLNTEFARNTASTVMSFLVVFACVCILGLVLPRKIASVKEGTTLCLRVVYPAITVLSPLLRLFAFLSNCTVKLFGLDPDRENAEVTEEEILMMVDAGNETGTIEESQKEMITNIFEFDDRTAADIMTHRTEVSAVDINASLSEVTQLALETGYSRIPVYEETMDNIIGVLYVKDLLGLIGECAKPFDIHEYMREVMYVPESKRCRDLFESFTEKKVQFAVVIDEYGGTSGVVTMEDLLESIVGNIQDEYDNEEEEIVENADGSLTVNASVSLDDIAHRLDMELSEEDEDYDTLGGLVLDRIGYLPNENDSVEYLGYRFTVLKVDDRKIELLHVEPVEIDDDDESSDKKPIFASADSEN